MILEYERKMNKEYLGFSDIATLIAVGIQDKDIKTSILSFGGDGDYWAWVDREGITDMGKLDYYEKIASFNTWLKMYDDQGCTFDECGDFDVYRAGDFGLLIRRRTNG